ncbi:MAG: hypothetical protein EU530_05320 [Promethearchaeota archaeon]|nr:MAG: hypothetical protein EU530_05320 [Candidatus Lokiarchaeota archaeon]
MGQMTHRLMFTILFSVGVIGFGFAFLFQFQILPTIVTQELIRWTAPIGLGFVIIGGTGMHITSRRHQMKKLKQDGISVEDEGERNGQQGSRFQDYITSPEEGTTVYALFLAGVVIIVWGSVMFVQWIRSLF